MSKIDKLSILGVRSFDNTRSETIQFHTPLTLIVGYNGSGKTTIIECLKYATTGELPPNSARNGAFIHDPSLCGEKEVLAQVKLSFKNTTGAKMIATRSLQVTVKKTTRPQKTLECNLVTIKDGERSSISSRVVELDQLLPQYIGVSKAILESVIFCHQDESLWPMSESSVLKKRFDEIFEALKYSKAIENLKILRKKQNEELGKLKIIEEHAKQNKIKGEKAEARSSVLYDEIEVLRTQSHELAEKIKEASQHAQEAYERAAKYDKIVGRLEIKRTEAQTLQRNVEDLRKRLKEMSDSDEQLMSILNQYEERVAAYRDEMEVQRHNYNKLAKDIEANRQRLGIKQSEVGKFEAQKEQYERQLSQREALIKETARRHKIRGLDINLNDDTIREFVNRIEKMARDQLATLERARRETQEELQGAQTELNKLNERKSALNQSKESCRVQITSNDKRITAQQVQLNSIEMDEGGKAILVSANEDIERKLGKEKSDYEKHAWDLRKQEAETRIRNLEDGKDKLDGELFTAMKQAGDSARLDYLQKELKDRQKSLDTMIGAHGDRISSYLGREWSPSSLEMDFQSKMNSKFSDLKDVEAQRDGVARELEQVDFLLGKTRDNIKSKSQELQECVKIIEEAIGDDDPGDYPDALEHYERELQVKKTDLSSFQVQSKYYTDCLRTVEKENACRLCLRPLKNEREKSTLIKRLEKFIENATREAVEDDIKVTEEEFNKVRRAQPSYNSWLSLKETELPNLKVEEKRLKEDREKLVESLELQDTVVREKQEAKRDLEALGRIVQNITKYNSDISDFGFQIKELSSKQNSFGLSRGLEKIQEDLSKVNEESRLAKLSLNQVSGDRERARSTINELELESRDVKSKLSNAIYQLKERGGIVMQIEELKNMNGEQQESLRMLEIEIQNLAPKISQAQAKYDDINRRGADRDSELQQEASKLSESVHQLKLVHHDINAFVEKGGPEQLEKSRREIQELENESSSLEERQRGIAKEVKKLEDQLRNTDDTKREINENLSFRRGVRDLDAVREEVLQLESHNAENDKTRYDREGNKWQNELNKLSAEQASKFGIVKSKDDQLKQLIQDWETEYSDAAAKYKEAHVKVETTKAAVEDLGRYAGALDQAIMKYHGLKMEEINHIIEELWKRTYQGTDVDTIMIRSDNEKVGGNKSYNYRVVMVKQDAEMDMRGRCSAGQKVLASIIIRLALAECFGVNCGLIALDEPTTNLDRDNIRALAEALSEIIRVRRQQSNFQLIVITHDEDFLRFMNCADFCDHYYRVSRNERQKSIIERQSIGEVM